MIKFRPYSTNCFYGKQTANPFWLKGAGRKFWVLKIWHDYIGRCITVSTKTSGYLPLVNSQRKLSSVVGGRAQDLRKKRNKNKEHSWQVQIKTETKPLWSQKFKFLRFIVIESLEETSLAKLSPFLIGKKISSRANTQIVGKKN